MPKNKNALRKHYIGPYTEATPETPPTAEEFCVRVELQTLIFDDVA